MQLFRNQKIRAQEGSRQLEISPQRFYQLYSGYLRACAERREDEWEPGISGGDHREEWPKTVIELLNRLLSTTPPSSYSFAASEVHRRHGIRLHRATVRRWAFRAGLAHSDYGYRPKAAVRRWQCGEIGALWQLDASPHRWWQGLKEPLPLLNILDDCSRVITGTRIYPRETLLAYFDFLPSVFQEYGLPLALYVDFHSFFFANQPEVLTELGRALRFYGISLRYAPTPQAKGKIERHHLFWQNRLPAFFAAEGITEIARANHQIHLLRQHHNEQEIHREIGMVPQNAWQKAIREKRSVLRAMPVCSWWPYVWSHRKIVSVGSDNRVPVGTQRLRIDKAPGSRVIRCLHPNGNVSYLEASPDPTKRPVILLQITSKHL